MRDDPISTANRFPKALSKTKTLSAVSAPRLRNTAVKKTDAAISPELENSSFGTTPGIPCQHDSTWGGTWIPRRLTGREVRNVAKQV